VDRIIRIGGECQKNRIGADPTRQLDHRGGDIALVIGNYRGRAEPPGEPATVGITIDREYCAARRPAI